MKQILNRLFEHNCLDRVEAREIMLRISRGEFNESQMAAFITVFLMRSITTEELSGFRDALLELRVPVDLSGYPAIDIVGTGGDNKNTFNISTAACFVVAGAGYHVVKHGNYGASSVSGASNVMEAHGVRFTADPDRLRRSLDGCNMAFLHAQFFNPALKAVAPVRKALGIRTFFNMLGPLVNPCLPKYQLLGVYNLKLGRMYNYLYQQGPTEYTIVNSLDGYDEISLTADFKCFDRHGERVVSPESIGFDRCTEADLSGGETVEDAARIFDAVLGVSGSGQAITVPRNTVIINAAYAIQTMDRTKPMAECITLARESIESGAAARTLKLFIELNS